MGFNCYIHIPFCSSKCKYCHFASFSRFQDLHIEKYVNFLCFEISIPPLLPTGEGVRGGGLDTIYFGGGTPGMLSLKHFEKIFKALREKFEFADDIEITIESNPENITLENLEGWKKLGVNRISIGVQTLNEKALKEAGRVGKGDIFKALEILTPSPDGRGGWGGGLSLDFIIGLPFVKKGEIKADIEILLSKYPFVNHFSVYMLEDYKTDFSSEEFLEEYLGVKAFLEDKDFERYEFSNFSKKAPPKSPSTRGTSPFACKHNLGYWQHKDCLAFGISAHGFISNTRFANSNKFEEYYAFKGKVEEVLNEEELFLEKMMFALRTTGIELQDSKKLNNEKIEEFLENGYLVKTGNKICLADKGVLLLDYILKEII